MKINPMPVYQKGTKPKRSNQPNAKQRERWERIRALGCRICRQPAEIHHCGTKAGQKKDHNAVIALCPLHHRLQHGIHSIGRPLWQRIYRTESWHMEQTARELGE